MKTLRFPSPTLIGLFAAAAAVSSACAQTVTVLESFESGVDSATLMTWGGRPALDPPGVALSQYAKAGDEDPVVTHGTKALQVDLSGSEWYSTDFRITLSDEASAKLREAQASGGEARYVLRWDYTFPPSGSTAWMNSAVSIDGTSGTNDQLDTNNGRRSYSIPLDLIGTLPAEGPISLIFAQNFDATEDPFVGLTVYVDNIRLVDTYVAGAQPQVYELQSFESADDPTGGASNFTGWGGGTRTTYSRHQATDAEDPRVSHGTHSLKVDYANTGTWGSDFTLPFAGTKLAEVLKLDLPAEERPTPAQLARYTLRFDVIYPARADDWTDGWMNTSYHTLADGLPLSQGGTLAQPDTAGFRKTYSVGLDEVSGWSDSVDPKPVLMFVANGAWGPSGTTIYYDHFRLIDTGATGGGTPAPKITRIQYSVQGSSLTLVWDSVAGKNYAIDGSENLGSWPTVVAASVAGQAGTTTYTATVPALTRSFYRVRALD